MTDTLKLQRPVDGGPAADAGSGGAAAAPPQPPARKRSLGRIYALLVATPLLFVVAGIVAFWHFVHFAFLSNPALNSLIAIVMLWGSATMFVHVRRVYREDRVFFAGLSWLKLGAWSDEPDPKLGPDAHVLGMLGRLQKLGLGHQVYVQSAAMEPELDALEQFFEKKQELSQFIVGLMVGLGLLGTFVGLLETLIATSSLISTIAHSVGGASSGGMESEFARIVGGLQKPLEAMGTAFSASMFGLIGSIMLGFQMIVVRKTAADFVDHVRDEVLSLAEKTEVNANVEITERFLANLLADILQQHKDTLARLDGVSAQLGTLVPEVREVALSSNALGLRVQAQEDALTRTVTAVGSVRELVPVLQALAQASSSVFKESREANARVGALSAVVPQQAQTASQMTAALEHIDALIRDVDAVKRSTDELLAEARAQAAVVHRLDATLLGAEKAALRQALEAD